MTQEQLLNKIVEQELVNAPFVRGVGLDKGRMGISAFFYALNHSGASTDYPIEMMADNLMSSIYEDITKKIELSVETGLAGIGVGTDFLLEKNILEGDADDLLSDIDKEMQKERNFHNNTFEKFKRHYDYGIYYLCRIKQLEKICNLQDYKKLEMALYLIDDIGYAIDNKNICVRKQVIEAFLFLKRMYLWDIEKRKVARLIQNILQLELPEQDTPKMVSDEILFQHELHDFCEKTEDDALQNFLKAHILAKEQFGAALNDLSAEDKLAELRNFALQFVLYTSCGIPYLCSKDFFSQCFDLMTDEWWQKTLERPDYTLKDGMAGIGMALLFQKEEARMLIQNRGEELINSPQAEKTECIAKTKIAANDLTIIIPYKYDSEQRLKNLQVLLHWLNNNVGATIKVWEYGTERTLFGDVLKDMDYKFHANQNFHRTLVINRMIISSDTNYFACWDTDMLIDENLINEALSKLRHNKVSMVIPYNGVVRCLSESVATVLKSYSSFDFLRDIAPSLPIYRGKHACGGIYFGKKDDIMKCGAENELFVDWGPEDIERVIRFQGMGLNIARCEGEVFHLQHPTGTTSMPNKSETFTAMGNVLLQSAKI